MTFFLMVHILKNVLTRGTPEYCKWYFRVPQHPGWEPLAQAKCQIFFTL